MKHAATKMVIPPIPNKCCRFELRFSSKLILRVALLNFTSGIRLTKSINSSRGDWAQRQHVLPSTYKGGDAEFVVTKQQASCLGWSHFCSLLNEKRQ